MNEEGPQQSSGTLFMFKTMQKHGYSFRLSRTVRPCHSNIGHPLHRASVCHAAHRHDLGISFYSILDVSHDATSAEIRQGYLSLIRELHPDLHGNSGATTALCSIVNEVYETLSDDDKRATYDILSGFLERSVNPFLDPSMQRTQLFVDEANCIGCGKCVRWDPSACTAT